MEAEIIISYDNVESAKAVAEAVSPDNFKVPPGLSIKTEREGSNVVTRVKCGRKLQTCIATVDDLLFAVSLAEKTLKTARKLE
ncbi:KEOPS complex subunit [Candidatus Bathyarchaeota archaeon]|nr:MAG: KEOPS complex subunit [Candidatus Bathyarchaeota archaeon]